MFSQFGNQGLTPVTDVPGANIARPIATPDRRAIRAIEQVEQLRPAPIQEVRENWLTWRPARNRLPRPAGPRRRARARCVQSAIEV